METKIKKIQKEIKSLAFKIDDKKFENKDLFRHLLDASAQLELALFDIKFEKERKEDCE